MNNWNNFNSADDQISFDPIPRGTLTKVRMTIKPGGFDDDKEGWTGGYATQNESTGSVYLNCEFVILEGTYAKRRIWSIVGLYSEKGATWANMGRSFIKSVLNSAYGLDPQDESQTAQRKRCIDGFADLDGIVFVARIDIEKDQYGDDKNVIKKVITKEHKDYARLMGKVDEVIQASKPSVSSRPSWAQ